MSKTESAREVGGTHAEGMGGAEPGAERRSNWEAVIGIECHVELKTASKMFCGCANEFGGEPNTKVCPVCLALPGALPVPNAKAIELMIAAGLAFDAEIPAFSKFDRKNYFYPDMPKNYQISQYDMPLTQGGVVHYWLQDGTKKSCRLTRIHLEEDTGKSTHAGSGDGRIAGSSYSLVDFNRAGVPLMECVGEPDIRSADEAVGYLEALKRTFVELGVSDVKMEEGSLRCDANVSVRLRGAAEYGTKAEIKNMNSFRSVHDAIESEIDRQIAVIEGGGRVIQETRGWDEAAGVTHSMRSKEQAHDYRYFPEPDLVPLEIDRAVIERIRATMPPVPFERFERYTERFGISVKQTTQLVDNPPLAAFFDRVVAIANAPSGALNFVLGDLSRLANESGTSVAGGKVTPEALAELIALTEAKTINSKIAKDVLTRLWADGGSAKSIVENEGLAQVSDPGAIAHFVDDVLAANAESVAQFKAGKENVLKFLVGQVMKTSRGKANPELVETLLREKIAAR
jgi:aspartyl-tRNA(Asn)/glutamyl-tRNA(Gln) amidotransferase subunit B